MEAASASAHVPQANASAPAPASFTMRLGWGWVWRTVSYTALILVVVNVALLTVFKLVGLPVKPSPYQSPEIGRWLLLVQLLPAHVLALRGALRRPFAGFEVRRLDGRPPTLATALVIYLGVAIVVIVAEPFILPALSKALAGLPALSTRPLNVVVFVGQLCVLQVVALHLILTGQVPVSRNVRVVPTPAA